MSSKKKLIIAIAALCIVLIVSVTSVVLILAALNTTAKSGIKIKYTAYNVDATVTATYQISDQSEVNIYTDTAKTNPTIEFAKTDATGIEKSFQPTGDIEIGPTDKIVFHYVITNLDSVNNLYFSLVPDFTAMENFEPIAHGSATPLVDKMDIDSYEGIEETYTIAPNQAFNMYLIFWVMEDTQDAIFEGTMDFVLTISDPNV